MSVDIIPLKLYTLIGKIKYNIPSDAVSNNIYKIELVDVQIGDGEQSTFNYDVVYDEIRILSNINTLKKLEVTNHKITPTFDSNITSYKVTTTNSNITINAIKTDESSTITGDIGEQELAIGANNFRIYVTSARGEIRTYNLYVTRKIKDLPKSSDITLKNISLSTGKLDFDKNKFLYTINVDNTIENIDIKALPNNAKATVNIEKPDKLVIGENTITITVIAEDGTVGKYVIIVNRKEKLSNDATIKKLHIKGYNLNFDSSNYEYLLAIKDEKSLDIEVILNNDKSKYKITGNKNLTNNSTIKITVTAEDNTKKEYKIKITKEIESNTNNFNIITLMPLCCLIILISLMLTLKVIKVRDKQNNK